MPGPVHEMSVIRLRDGREAQSAIPSRYLESLLFYAERSPPGAIVEVGVYRGGSALLLSTLKRDMYLYDTFEGIPFQGELDRDNEVGKFSETSAEMVQKLLPEAKVIKGLFPDSLVAMPPVSFVHADADQYESTKAILEVLPPLMVKGGMMLFDDFGHPGTEGCTRAVVECPYRVLLLAESSKALIIL
jgi:predicted O-methyltransferase YrrM